MHLIALWPGRIGAKIVTVLSTFDMVDKRFDRHIQLCAGLSNRHSTFAFAEIQGIGLKEFIDYDAGGSSSDLPAITLASGQHRYLAFLNASAPIYAPAVDEVCKATGPPRLDHAGSTWGLVGSPGRT